MARRSVQTLVAALRRRWGQLPARRGDCRRDPVRGLTNFACRRARRSAPMPSCSRSGRGCPSSSLPCLAEGSSRLARKCFSLRPRRAIAVSCPARCRAGPISTAATSIMDFPTSRAAGSSSRMTRTASMVDPDTQSRRPTKAALDRIIAFRDRRFPLLRGAPLTEARVCQYENSSNGDFLIDRHPELANVVLVGGGSGHGFKHGPEVGRLAAALVSGSGAQAEPRFTLATKAEPRSAKSIRQEPPQGLPLGFDAQRDGDGRDRAPAVGRRSGGREAPPGRSAAWRRARRTKRQLHGNRLVMRRFLDCFVTDIAHRQAQRA